ncbi:MAG: hypothetical protein FJ104_14335, partial [Deltaproteobacteria bacterium]|nr:hypothetical protein [Deltaproteobacteria bacterium]
DHAGTCDAATSAASATLADDASKLGGFAAADYLRSASGALQEVTGTVSVRDGGITGAMLAKPLAYTGDATFTDDAAQTGAALAVKSGANTLSLGGSSLECTADMTVNATGKKRVTFGGPVTLTGDETVTGALRIGHEVRRCTNATTCGCSSTSHVVLGGGVKDSNAVYESYPSAYLGVPGWDGKCGTDGVCSEMWVICARLAP